MDDQQTQSVTRIRLAAHECLRDHVGSQTLLIANPENDVVERIRGKEMIRRGLSKRRRKEDHEEYYSSAVNVDQEQLYQTHSFVPQNLRLPVNAARGVDETRDYGAAGEVDDSDYQNAAEEESTFSHATAGVVQQSPLENSEDVILVV